MVLLCVLALGAITPMEDRKYMRALDAEIARLKPMAVKAGTLDHAIDAARSRSRQLDQFRSRSKADLDAILEVTRLLQPPASLQTLELSRNSIVLNGSAEQAAKLLKLLDGSPVFQGSEFTVPLIRNKNFDFFRIRSARKGVPQ
jgi:hypothetical protein